MENSQKEIQEKDLLHITSLYGSDHEFLQQDFHNFRMQNYTQEFIQNQRQISLAAQNQLSFQQELRNFFDPLLGSDSVETLAQLFAQVSKTMGDSFDSKVFWLTFFKTERSCPAVTFFEKI